MEEEDLENKKEEKPLQIEENKGIKFPKIARYILDMIKLNCKEESENEEAFKGLGQINLEKKVELFK